MENSNALSFREAKRGSERRRASITSSLCDSIDTDALARFEIRETWNGAKQLISSDHVLQIVTWLYSQRKMILLACSHFVATVIIWSECTTHLETALTYVNTCLTTHISFYIFIYLVSPLLYCQVTMRWWGLNNKKMTCPRMHHDTGPRELSPLSYSVQSMPVRFWKH